MFKVDHVYDYQFNAKLNRKEWRIHWLGWPSEDDTWEPWQNLISKRVQQMAIEVQTMKQNEQAQQIKETFKQLGLGNSFSSSSASEGDSVPSQQPLIGFKTATKFAAKAKIHKAGANKQLTERQKRIKARTIKSPPKSEGRKQVDSKRVGGKSQSSKEKTIAPPSLPHHETDQRHQPYHTRRQKTQPEPPPIRRTRKKPEIFGSFGQISSGESEGKASTQSEEYVPPETEWYSTESPSESFEMETEADESSSSFISVESSPNKNSRKKSSRKLPKKSFPEKSLPEKSATLKGKQAKHRSRSPSPTSAAHHSIEVDPAVLEEIFQPRSEPPFRIFDTPKTTTSKDKKGKARKEVEGKGKAKATSVSSSSTTSSSSEFDAAMLSAAVTLPTDFLMPLSEFVKKAMEEVKRQLKTDRPEGVQMQKSQVEPVIESPPLTPPEAFIWDEGNSATDSRTIELETTTPNSLLEKTDKGEQQKERKTLIRNIDDEGDKHDGKKTANNEGKNDRAIILYQSPPILKNFSRRKNERNCQDYEGATSRKAFDTYLNDKLNGNHRFFAYRTMNKFDRPKARIHPLPSNTGV